eukprot:11195639-Lingulodinium_polyedra.AAC.1
MSWNGRVLGLHLKDAGAGASNCTHRVQNLRLLAHPGLQHCNTRSARAPLGGTLPGKHRAP